MKTYIILGREDAQKPIEMKADYFDEEGSFTVFKDNDGNKLSAIKSECVRIILTKE